MKMDQLTVCKQDVAATGKLCVSKHNQKKMSVRHQERIGFCCLQWAPKKHRALTKALFVHVARLDTFSVEIQYQKHPYPDLKLHQKITTTYMQLELLGFLGQ